MTQKVAGDITGTYDAIIKCECEAEFIAPCVEHEAVYNAYKCPECGRVWVLTHHATCYEKGHDIPRIENGVSL